MLAVRHSEFQNVRLSISALTQPPLRFSTLDDRKRREDLKPANDTLIAFMAKSVGVNVEDQAGWLLYHLKRLYPNGKHLEVIMEDYKQLRDFSSVSTHLRRNYTRAQYKIFQNAVKKFSGSTSMDTHRQFLKAQYSAMHQTKAGFHPLDEKS